MKKIAVVIPCYNEEKSVYEMHEILTNIFKTNLSNYDYEIIFNDDFSTDNTREELKKICGKDKKVKAVLNAKNFGFNRNVFFSLTQSDADATFMLFGDMQDPPQLLPEFVKEWEKGYKVIVGQKTHSDENKIVYFLRTIFYKFVDKLSPVKQIQHANGFGLYDKLFVDTLRQVEDPNPYFKGLIGEYAMNLKILQYSQHESQRGHSNQNFFKMYDIAMLGITSYTKALMRMATFFGLIIGLCSLFFAIFAFLYKIFFWNALPMGSASIIIGIFFIGSIQIYFLGILGEYILSLNSRSIKKPLIVASEKINFNSSESGDHNGL